MEDVRVVTVAERVRALPETPGLVREQALHIGSMWAGCACTSPGGTSDWHHHGDWNTVVYVVNGAVRLEFGSDGGRVAEAGPGDFLFIPAHVVHREINPASRQQDLVVFRHGRGPLTVNVDGPAADHVQIEAQGERG